MMSDGHLRTRVMYADECRRKSEILVRAVTNPKEILIGNSP